MRYACLACDFDGTLASDGVVTPDVLQALTRLAASGRKLVLVTGRKLDDLFRLFPHVGLFDYVVCENGAVLYHPATRVARLLAEPPPRRFVENLQKEGVYPLEVGRIVVATFHPNESKILETLHTMGLDLHITFNKGAVMVLPAGVNKGTGLSAALRELRLSRHNVVAVGDAENDHSLLSMAECSVAVANALPVLKERAHITTTQDSGQGVVELIDRLLDSDLVECEELIKTNNVLFGHEDDEEGRCVKFRPHDYRILIAGPSQSGKSSVCMSILEQFASSGYQYCIIDPEGEYDQAPRSVTVGNEHYAPEVEDIVRVLENPDDNVVVNLLGVSLSERPQFLVRIFAAIQQLRRLKGRPHWVVVDEAHHMLHPYWNETFEPVWHEPGAMVIVTVDPSEISSTVLSGIDMAIAVGIEPRRTLTAFAEKIDQKLPEFDVSSLGWGEALVWFRHEYGCPRKIKVVASPFETKRHLRKYADGDLGSQRSFYFTGPGRRFQIKCQNLFLFMQIGDGIDDETWMFHLRRGDYSVWFRHVIRDPGLAEEAATIERDSRVSAQESRLAVRRLIEARYTLPTHLPAFA